MAITGSGQVSLGDIQTEFGGSNPIGLSEYYGEGNAPASGEIQLAADFYGTSSWTASEGHTLIATATASGSATLAFSSGIDSTYDVYEFVFTNMHPATDNVDFSFQVNAAGASGFNETITSTAIDIYHNEADGTTSLDYHAGLDQAQGSAYQKLIYGVGADSDQSCSGVVTLYAPASTTYVKHFVAETNSAWSGNFAMQELVAGYINTTSAIDEISFKFHSGNIGAGQIKMYGIAKA